MMPAMSVEEWWGRTFERRGSVTIGSMPDDSSATIQKLPTEDVLELIRSEESRSVRGLLAQYEMRRRENWTARAALVISVLALTVSAIAH
jgi:hypothetical protein